MLFTEYRKRRTRHFMLETSYDEEAAKDFIAFCEQSYRDFLEWSGKGSDYDLWDSRAHVTIIANKNEWECLMQARNPNASPEELERQKKIGGSWSGPSLEILKYSAEGSTRETDKEHVFHMLNHLFIQGLSKARPEEVIWWLWESFSIMRGVDVFGSTNAACISFETAAQGDKEQAWQEIDNWVALLKKDVRARQDEDLEIFLFKNLMAIERKTFVKGWSLIRYLTRSKKEKAKFIEFIERLRTKKDQWDALEQVFGWNPDKVDKEWRSWIKRQPSRWRRSPHK